MRKTQFFTLLAIFASASAVQAAGWMVTPDTSSVSFQAEQQGSKFTGKFGDFSAEIDFDPAMAASGSIVGIVKTDSVDTRDYDRDGYLVGPEFFDPEQYPEARFESESIEATADGKFVAHGQLTLKGQTKPVDLTFTFTADGGSAKFEGTLPIDRFQYNVGEGWNDTYMVGKDVEVRIALDLTR